MLNNLLASLLVISVFASLLQLNSRMRPQTNFPAGYWPIEKSQPIIDKTEPIRLAPDLSHLSAGEREAVAKLLEVGKIFQKLYEDQRHPQALSSFAALEKLDRRTGSTAVTSNLLTLYRLFQGPIATTLENKREPFLAVDSTTPAKNVYPSNLTREEIESYLKLHPEEKKEILDQRMVVRRKTAQNLQTDLFALKKYPVLDTLHPGLKHKLTSLSKSSHHRATARLSPQPNTIHEITRNVTNDFRVGSRDFVDGFSCSKNKNPRISDTDSIEAARKKSKTQGHQSNTTAFYAVPYSVAYADHLMKAYKLLNEAADAVQQDDEEFAKFLRNRARDLLSDDYESGDAAWVTGHFKNLNAQIGSYETYDDELYGVKTFFALSLLSTRQQETSALRQAMKGLQALEESLPYNNHKKIREDIPVGVYDVVADFGQARGGNTATILPNETYLARRYGRIILLRANIMRDPNIFQGTSRSFAAGVGPDQAKELTSDGNFYRTLWHEVGHYLGVDRTKDGRDLDEALQDSSNAMEEMKADLVSLFVTEALRKQGYYNDAQLRSVYAGGVLRVLQNNKPRRDQPYQTMQLMQWNYFLENGLLTFEDGIQEINYDRYHDTVRKLLAKVLEVQYQGDKTAADQFIEQYTKWDDNLHGVVAKNIRDQQRYRFRLFKYAALGE